MRAPVWEVSFATSLVIVTGKRNFMNSSGKSAFSPV